MKRRKLLKGVAVLPFLPKYLEQPVKPETFKEWIARIIHTTQSEPKGYQWDLEFLSALDKALRKRGVEMAIEIDRALFKGVTEGEGSPT